MRERGGIILRLLAAAALVAAVMAMSIPAMAIGNSPLPSVPPSSSPSPSSPPPPGQSSLSPSHGPAGQRFTVTYSYPDCSRYPAARYVDVYWVDNSFNYLGSVAFDPQSCAAVSYAATVPATVPRGVYVVWARLSDASKSYIGGDAFPPSNFTVDPTPSPSPRPSPSPKPSHPARTPTPGQSPSEFTVVQADDPPSSGGVSANSVKPATAGRKGFDLLAFVPGGAVGLAGLAFLIGAGILVAAITLEMRRRR